MRIALNRTAAGFSLIEMMCAILILGIALVGLVQGITTALGSSKESELHTAAALIAAGQVELLRAEGFLMEGETEGECGDMLPAYRWRQSVAVTAIDGLHEIGVTVEHSSSGRVIYELKTLLFDPPLFSTEENPEDGSRSRPGSRPGRGGAS